MPAPLLLLVPFLAAAVTGCGNLTAGGFGEATVVMSGDAPDSQQTSAARTAAPALASFLPSFATLGRHPPAAVGIEGQLRATLRVFLEDEEGNLVALTSGDARSEVDLQGEIEDELSTTDLDPGLYPRIRIVFTEIEADVVSGLVIEGVPVEDVLISVEGLEGDSLVVEREGNVDIREGARVELLLDMNSSVWLQDANPLLGTVTREAFEAAFEFRVR